MLDLKLLKENKALLALCITSIAIFPSLFLGPKVIGIVFLIYMGVIAWCLVSFIGIDFFRKLEADDSNEQDERGKRKAKYAFFLIPLVIAGVVMALIQIFALLFLY